MSRVFYAGSCKNAEFTCPRKFQWTYLPNGRTMAMTSIRPDFQLLIETAVVLPGEWGGRWWKHREWPHPAERTRRFLDLHWLPVEKQAPLEEIKQRRLYAKISIIRNRSFVIWQESTKYKQKYNKIPFLFGWLYIWMQGIVELLKYRSKSFFLVF